MYNSDINKLTSRKSMKELSKEMQDKIEQILELLAKNNPEQYELKAGGSCKLPFKGIAYASSDSWLSIGITSKTMSSEQITEQFTKLGNELAIMLGEYLSDIANAVVSDAVTKATQDKLDDYNDHIEKARSEYKKLLSERDALKKENAEMKKLIEKI